MGETLLSAQKIKQAEILEAAIVSAPLEIQPIISYPRELAVNKTYLVTIDILSSSTDISWGYPDEEYSVYCRVRGSSGLSVESIDEPFVVLHRFGGTYGPARFYLKAEKIVSSPTLSITLLKNGMPLHSFEITDIKVVEKAQKDQVVGKRQVSATEISDRKLVQKSEVDTNKNAATAKNINKSIGVDYKYDVFISYSHKDEEWVVNTLLPVLENAGLKVCIDFRDFIPGKPSRHNMRDACKESKYTVLVMTPAWMASEWTSFEGLLTFLHDPANKHLRTVPILFEKCDIPENIQIFTYIDFLRKDREAIAWKQLFTALGKPNAPIPRMLIKESEPKTPEGWFLAHPYGMPPNFTGRRAERNMLTDWLNSDKDHPLLIIRALGGFGKSALAWQWLTHDVDSKEWSKALWWSFYEGDASFERFVEKTLKYLKRAVPQSKREQVDELLNVMQSQKVLLIMDGFERALRTYSSMSAAYQGDEEPKLDDNQLDCIDVNAESFLKSVCSLPNIKSKILMTTRLTPRAIKSRGEFMLGCREEELIAMDRIDAVNFFRAMSIKGTRAEVEAACEPYGYHPLSLRLLAGRILKDFDNPADIVVAQRLKIDGDLKQHQHHVLEVSYNSLPSHKQKLLSTIACFRSSVELKTLEAIVENRSSLNDDLRDLVGRGLLHFNDMTKKFDLHPIVRRFAYDQFTAFDRTAEHTRLVNYFEVVPKPEKVTQLEDLAPVIELYHHLVRAGNLDEGLKLCYERINKLAYYQFGAYQLQIELLRALFPDGEDKPPRLKKKSDQAWTLNALANSYSLSGQPRRAVPLIETHNAMQEKTGNKKNLAIGLGNLAGQQLVIGALSQAERNLRYVIDLCHEIDYEHYEAINRQEIGRVLAYRGEWNSSEQEIETATNLLEKQSGSPGIPLILGDKVSDAAFYSLQPVISGGISQKNPKSQQNNDQSLSALWSYRALRFLLMAREAVGSNQLSIECAKRALELADEWARTHNPTPRDYIRAYWLLGSAYCANNGLTLAEENLSKALNLCRQINLAEVEADILLDLARLRYAQGDFKDAQETASEALMITERGGYVLQGADVNLFLAQYALEQEKDKTKAKAYAESALKLAYCDGPPYYYKVAYEEAERFLEKLK